MKLLKITKQCAKCPWKVSTNPHDIPDGYCETRHAALKDTIANGLNISQPIMKVMACHHSNGEDNMYCVGWLHNQLGVGNNIALRIKMRECENIRELKVIGKHAWIGNHKPMEMRKTKRRYSPTPKAKFEKQINPPPQEYVLIKNRLILIL